jgi:hypothetical protein
VLPVLVAGLQWWMANNIIMQLPVHRITDGSDYIGESWSFLTRAHWYSHLHATLLYGLYAWFLSFFHIPGLQWATAGNSPFVIPVYRAQSTILALATFAFLLVAAFAQKTLLRRVALCVALGAFMLSPMVFVWPAALLMESLTLTAVLICMSAALTVDAHLPHSKLLLAACSCLIVLTRDPLITFVTLFVVLTMISQLVTTRRVVSLLVFGAVMVVAIARIALIEREHGDKYVQPLANVIQLRILSEESRRDYFVRHGMPLSAPVMERADKPAQYKQSLWKPDAELSPGYAAWRDWLMHRGFGVYGRFLLSHPAYVLRAFAKSPNHGPQDSSAHDVFFSIADLFSTPMPSGYWLELSPLPHWLGAFLLAPLGWPLAALYFVGLCIGHLRALANRRPVRAVDSFALAAFLCIVPTYHADGLDEWRHCVPLLIAIYAAFPIIALCWLGSGYGVVMRALVSGGTRGRHTGFTIIEYSVIGLGVTVACACIYWGVRAVRY